MAVAGTPSAQSHAQLPTGSSAATPAPRVGYAGLPNFGVVSDQLYRGAQPADSGFAELKALGIAIVVNLRHESGRIARERTLVESLGMHYVSIPWRGHDDPNPEQVAQFLRLLRDNPQRKVFVHCERGSERTGVMVASYRISREQWTPERAQAEMEAFGFRRRRFAHLTRFVREFPTLLLRDPGLRSTIRFDRGLVEIRDRPRLENAERQFVIHPTDEQQQRVRNRMRWTCPTIHLNWRPFVNGQSRVGIDDRMLQRACGEFLEMPGLCLTCRQAQRLWGLDEPTCRELLEFLVDAKFLRRSSGGMYARTSDGGAETPRLRMARAVSTTGLFST